MNGAVHLQIKFPSNDRPSEVLRPVSAFEPPLRRRVEKRKFGEIMRAAIEAFSAAVIWGLVAIVAAWRARLRNQPTAAAEASPQGRV